MSEEIIINGIDVSECRFYEPKAQKMTCHEESITKRCDKTNCYFKQLKRLQQENEELKSLLDFEIQKREVFADKSIKYEFALEEIRNEIGDLKNINRLINLQKILDIIDEVLNDRN